MEYAIKAEQNLSEELVSPFGQTAQTHKWPWGCLQKLADGSLGVESRSSR